MDLSGRIWEIWGVGWWENVYNLFNNYCGACDIIEMWDGDGEVKEDEVGGGFVRMETVLTLR